MINKILNKLSWISFSGFVHTILPTPTYTPLSCSESLPSDLKLGCKLLGSAAVDTYPSARVSAGEVTPGCIREGSQIRYYADIRCHLCPREQAAGGRATGWKRLIVGISAGLCLLSCIPFSFSLFSDCEKCLLIILSIAWPLFWFPVVCYRCGFITALGAVLFCFCRELLLIHLQDGFIDCIVSKPEQQS